MKTIIAGLFAAFALPALAENAGLDPLSFMAGHWVQKDGREEVQETWLGPRGDTLAGVNLTHRPESRASFEFLRIAMKNGQPVYFASPGGRPPVEFPVKEIAAGSVVFENMAHDFPQRIVYRRIDADTLLARIEGTVQGKTRAQEWRFTRAR